MSKEPKTTSARAAHVCGPALPWLVGCVTVAAVLLLWGDRLELPFVVGLDDVTPLRLVIGLQLALFAVVLPLVRLSGWAELLTLGIACVPVELAVGAATQGRIDWQTLLLARLMLAALGWAALSASIVEASPGSPEPRWPPGTRAAVGGALLGAPPLLASLLVDAGVAAGWVASLSPLAILDAEHAGRGLACAGIVVVAWGVITRWRR